MSKTSTIKKQQEKSPGGNEHDFQTIEAAVMETKLGRWFLGEYAKRHRNADTNQLLDAIANIENSIKTISTNTGKDEPLPEETPADCPNYTPDDTDMVQEEDQDTIFDALPPVQLPDYEMEAQAQSEPEEDPDYAPEQQSPPLNVMTPDNMHALFCC